MIQDKEYERVLVTSLPEWKDFAHRDLLPEGMEIRRGQGLICLLHPPTMYHADISDNGSWDRDDWDLVDRELRPMIEFLAARLFAKEYPDASGLDRRALEAISGGAPLSGEERAALMRRQEINAWAGVRCSAPIDQIPHA